MHEVHAFTRFGVPPTTVRTVWMFGFQRRLVRRCECEMLWPKPGPLPHTSQLAATSIHLYRVVDAAGCVRTARLRALRKSRRHRRAGFFAQGGRPPPGTGPGDPNGPPA